MKRKTFTTTNHSFTAFIKQATNNFFMASVVSYTHSSTELFDSTTEEDILDQIRAYISVIDGSILYESQFYVIP